jgi:hypothetical protein
MRASWLLLTGGALIAAPLLAQSATTVAVPGEANAQGDVAVTIYNNNQALVQDVRQMNIPAGRSRQEFPDVSAQIRPETVTLSGDGFGIVEQNFDYDLLSPAALMQKAVGQTVTLLRTNPATGAETRERAKVLAVNGGAVLQIGDRIEVLRDDGLPVRVIFDRVPPNLRARPTLSVTVDATRAGPRPLTLSYLTPGIGWNADYVALFDEKAGKIDMQGWITLSNNTGTTFANAKALLVAGNVGPIQQQYPRYFTGAGSRPRGNRPGTETGSREQLGDFYLYPIEGRTTIANAQTKQVSFLDVLGANAAKGYEFRNGWLATSDEAESASSILKFSNARAGGIGDALPAGTVRVYMRDSRGQAQFIGESGIPHTPGGSDLALRTGDAFDVKVQPIQEKREEITLGVWESYARYKVTYADGKTETTVSVSQYPRYFYRTQMRYIVTNAKSVPIKVDVIQGGLRSWWWWRDIRIPEETIQGKQLNADERLWEVPVPANGKTELTVTFLTPW